LIAAPTNLKVIHNLDFVELLYTIERLALLHVSWSTMHIEHFLCRWLGIRA
jgi:hypothetical protein